MIKVLVFLGNPGREYNKTRHNVGQMIAQLLDQNNYLISPWTKKFKGSYSRAKFGNSEVQVLQPETFYNKSGESLQSLIQFYKYSPDEILVVHDDLETPYQTLTLQFSGGLGGNNGLKSIKQHCGGENFFRLKVGIDRPVHGKPDAWVLGKFSPDQEITLPRILDQSVTMIKTLLTDGEHEKKIKKGIKEHWSL